jgi:homospermidine synthase
MRHPDRGVIEPEEMDYAEIMDFIRPYLGQVVGEYSDWTPLQDRGRLFEEDLDGDDPWQFLNFRVV